MGMCKQCGKVFNSSEMEQGYCKDCKTADLLENDKNLDKERNQKTEKDNIILTLLMISLLIFFIGYIVYNSNESNDSIPKSQEQITKDLLHSQFSTWDGSHPALVEKVKSAMNNPDSFEHVETRFGWLDDSKNSVGDKIAVAMKYRGINAFGGVVTEEVVAHVDTNGNVLEIIE